VRVLPLCAVVDESKSLPRIVYRRREPTAAGLVKYADGRPALRLPPHPNPSHLDRHGRRPPVIPEAIAREVLEDLALPADADTACIYHGTVRVVDGDAELPPMPVHAIWFTPETADALRLEHDAVPRDTACALRSLAACSLAQDHSARSNPGQQPASGKYVELGWGMMAGGGRPSVIANGHSSTMPFRRSPADSAAAAEPLSHVMHACTSVLGYVLPQEALRSQAQAFHGCPADIAKTLQYPPLLSDTSPVLQSHQVVLRGPVERPDDTLSQREQRCLQAVSDLHVDTQDGGFELGAMTIYSCSQDAWAPDSDTQAARAALRYRDLAILTGRDGGRGVRLNVMRPGWCCCVLMKTSRCMHGGVTPDTDVVPMPTLALPPSMETVRAVTYPLSALERLMFNIAADPEGADAVRFLLRTHKLCLPYQAA
jgi:hypothetical protein